MIPKDFLALAPYLCVVVEQPYHGWPRAYWTTANRFVSQDDIISGPVSSRCVTELIWGCSQQTVHGWGQDIDNARKLRELVKQAERTRRRRLRK